MPGPTPKLSVDQLRELSKAHKQPLKSRAGSMTERLILAAGEGVRLRKGELPSWLSPRGEIFRHQVVLSPSQCKVCALRYAHMSANCYAQNRSTRREIQSSRVISSKRLCLKWNKGVTPSTRLLSPSQGSPYIQGDAFSANTRVY
jgi:hypothetical protein